MKTWEWDTIEQQWYCKQCDAYICPIWAIESKYCPWCQSEVPGLYGKGTHQFITYRSGPNCQIDIAHLHPKSWLIGEFSDYIFPENFNDPGAFPDDTYYLVVDGKGIDVTDIENPLVSLAKKADIIVWNNAGDTCIYIKRGCEALFEKHFGKILETKKYNSLSDYEREYDKKFQEVYHDTN